MDNSKFQIQLFEYSKFILDIVSKLSNTFLNFRFSNLMCLIARLYKQQYIDDKDDENDDDDDDDADDDDDDDDKKQ